MAIKMQINRKLISKLVILILLLFLSNGCGNNFVKEDTDQRILDQVKNLTKSLHEVYRLEMTYEQFEKQTEDLFINPNYFDDETIFGYNGNEYRLKDLKGMSLEELQQHKENLLSISHLDFADRKFIVFVSKVYNDPDHDWKIVFTKQVDAFTDMNGMKNEVYTTKKYILAPVSGEWKIIEIGESLFYYNDEKIKGLGLSKEDYLQKNLHLHSFQNKPLEYVEVFELEPM